MSLGTNQNIQLLNMPQYQDVTRGLRETLLNNEQRALQKQATYSQSLENFTPVAKRQTISNVLNNINSSRDANGQSGVQLGLETQEKINSAYEKLNSNYENDMAQLKNLGYDIKKNTTYYDDDGLPIVDPKLEGLEKAGADLTLLHEQKLRTLNDALTEQYKKTPDFLDTVTSPKDAENRLAKALMSKGIDAETARVQARAEMSQYDIPDIDERTKALNKIDQERIDNIYKGLGSTTIGTGSKGSSTTKSKKKNYFDPAEGSMAEQVFEDSGIKEIKTKHGLLERYDAIYTDDLDSIKKSADTLQNLKKDDGTAFSNTAIYEALRSSVKGSGVVGGNKEVNLIEAAKYLKKHPNGTGKYGNTGSGSNYVQQTTKNQPSKAQQQEIKKLNDRMRARTVGKQRKTIADVLGKDFGARDELRYTDTGKVSKTKTDKTKNTKQLSSKAAVKKYGTNLKTLQDAIKSKKVSKDNPEVKSRLQELLKTDMNTTKTDTNTTKTEEVTQKKKGNDSEVKLKSSDTVGDLYAKDENVNSFGAKLQKVLNYTNSDNTPVAVTSKTKLKIIDAMRKQGVKSLDDYKRVIQTAKTDNERLGLETAYDELATQRDPEYRKLKADKQVQSAVGAVSNTLTVASLIASGVGIATLRALARDKKNLVKMVKRAEALRKKNMGAHEAREAHRKFIEMYRSTGKFNYK